MKRRNNETERSMRAFWIKHYYVEEEMTMPEIARLLKISISTVSRDLEQFGVSRRLKSGRKKGWAQGHGKGFGRRPVILSQVDRDRMKQLYEEGYTLRQIAKKEHVSHEFVRNVLHEEGVKMRKRGGP